jgi:phage protein U
MANTTLMQWGAIQFQVWPLNIHAYDHFTGSDFAKKEVMESIVQREWVGERDEEIAVRGRIFPMAIGGFANLEAFEAARRAAQSHILVRGSGTLGQNMGWYVCEDLKRGHEHLAPNGIGRVINFEARFARVDTPWNAGYYPQIFDMIQST